MAKKFSLEMDGLAKLSESFQKMADPARISKAVGTALEKSADHAQKKLESAVDSSKFNFDRTGETKKSLLKSQTANVNGDIISVKVGFDITGDITGHKGLPSIFLMRGTPRIKPDKKLYNAIYGSAAKKEIEKIQIDTFMDQIGGD